MRIAQGRRQVVAFRVVTRQRATMFPLAA